jgi:hypothetical protein
MKIEIDVGDSTTFVMQEVTDTAWNDGWYVVSGVLDGKLTRLEVFHDDIKAVRYDKE